MSGFRRIIVAYDGSPPAEDALALALRLRDPDDGVLTLACTLLEHPWHVPRRPAAIPEDVAAMLVDARDRIPPGIRVRRSAPVASSAGRGLTELAEPEDADLLVVGSSRHAAAGRVSLERTAGRLLHGAPCAVAVPPAGLRTTDRFRHIGVAYDGSAEARAALAAGYDIAAVRGAAVTIVHALAPPPPPTSITAAALFEADGLQARLRAQQLLDEAAELAPRGVNPRTVLVHGRPADVVREHLDGIVDLLITGSRGYGPLQRVLLGSVSEALTDGATQPVLVLPRHAASHGDVPGAGASVEVQAR